MGEYRVKIKALCFVLISALGAAVACIYLSVSKPEDAVQIINLASANKVEVKDTKPESELADSSPAADVNSEDLASINQSDSEHYTIEIGEQQYEDVYDYESIYESPEFYFGLKAVNPRSALLLGHYASMQPSLVTVDESRDYLNSRGYAFLTAMVVICERCTLGYMFYEKYALGRQMTPDEYVQFGKSPEFESSIEAALSTDEFQRTYTEIINF